MVVTNHNHTNAIVIRIDSAMVTLVLMQEGKLSACTIPFTEFRQEWEEESGYALDLALETFLHHVESQGASAEAAKGLARLKARLNLSRQFAVANLF